METINVKGLPEPVVRALAAVVDALRSQAPSEGVKKSIEKGETRRELPVLPGTVYGSLTRKEIYEDVG
jgi:hypothetical protein